MTIGEKLTKLRKENNLTQEQFAELLKVSRQSVSKWELDSAYPETEKLIRISKVFNCSLDYLLKDEIEQMDVNIESASEEAKANLIKSYILTYLSFPPIFGWIVAIFSLKLQKEQFHKKSRIILSVLGLVVSISLTALMVIGIIFGL